MYTKLTLSYHKNTVFFVILIVGIFGSLLTPIPSIDFASATSDEGAGDNSGGGDEVGGDNGGGGDEPEPESEPEPEPEPEPGPEPEPNPGLVPGPEPPVDPCLENPEAEGCIPEPPIDPCIENPAAEGCQPDPGLLGPSPQPMPPYEGCLLDPTLPECEPLLTPPVENCHPSYPGACIPGPPPDLNCGDVSARNFKVVGSDPHGFDGDNDGLGCEGSGNGGIGGGNGRGCDPSYPEDCIPPLPPDLNCGDSGVPNNVEVVPPDPHGFDGDNDGVGCEDSSGSGGGGNGGEGLLPQTNVKDKQIQQARNDIRFAGQLRRSSRPDSSKPRPRRVRSHDRHRCPRLHSRGAGHERIRTLRRCHLPYLLHLRTRPRRALGDVPMARPGTEWAKRNGAMVSAA